MRPMAWAPLCAANKASWTRVMPQIFTAVAILGLTDTPLCLRQLAHQGWVVTPTRCRTPHLRGISRPGKTAVRRGCDPESAIVHAAIGTAGVPRRRRQD